MLLSCLTLLSLILLLCREVYLVEKFSLSHPKNDTHWWYLDEAFIVGVILVVVFGMISSSMVEEEHYFWHFMTSTLFLLLLHRKVQWLSAGSMFKEHNRNCKIQLCSIFLLLICGRIMRGWHQGGVNWPYLPDISKWLELTGRDYLKPVQLVSGCLVICFGLYSLSLSKSKKIIVRLVGFSFSIGGLLVLVRILKFQNDTLTSSSYGSTLLAQIIYAVLAITTIGNFVIVPWLMPIRSSNRNSIHDINSSDSVPGDVQDKSPKLELRDSLYLIGWAYVLCWCVLQLLLQQPVYSMPIFLLLVEIMASILYFSYEEQHRREWVEVATASFFFFLASCCWFLPIYNKVRLF